MSISRIFYALTLLLTCSLLQSCMREDQDILIDQVIHPQEPEVIIDAHVVGRVIDGNNRVINNAIVTCRENKDLTSTNGIYQLQNTPINEKGDLLVVSKSGYVPAVVYYLPYANKTSVINAELSPLGLPQFSFEASEIQSLHFDHLAIQIEANAWRMQDGSLYTGIVDLYLHKDVVHGMMRVSSTEHRTATLGQKTTYLVEAISAIGEPLVLDKPINVSTGEDLRVFEYDQVRSTWKATSKNAIPSMGLLAVGTVNPAELSSIRIEGESGEPLLDVVPTFSTEREKAYEGVLPQHGEIKVYLPSDKSTEIVITDYCGNALVSQVLQAGESSEPIVIEGEKLYKVHSTVTSCDETLGPKDHVNFLLEHGDVKSVYNQESNEMTFAVPRCSEISRVTYYRGEERQYSLQYASTPIFGEIEMAFEGRCIGTVQGKIDIDGTPLLLDMDHFSISYEDDSQQQLVITDQSTHYISIDLTNKSQPLVKEMQFTDPLHADCVDETCMSVNVEIGELTTRGNPVKIKLKGKISGTEIFADFTNILK